MLPRGLRYGLDGGVYNDFQDQRFAAPIPIDVHTDYPEAARVQGSYMNSHFDTRMGNLSPGPVRSTPKRATVPVDFTGYRPVTCLEHTMTNPCAVISYRVNGLGGSHGYPTWSFNVTNQVIRLPLVTDFSFESQIAPRFSSALSAFNTKYGTLLGEGKETLEYLLLNLRRLHEATRAARHGDLRRLRRVIQSVHKGKWKPATAGNLWLEFRYGLMPLFYDIKSLMEDWNKVYDKTLKLYRLSYGHGEDSSSLVSFYDPLQQINFKTAYVTYSRRHRFGYVLRDTGSFGVWNNGSTRSVSDWKELSTALLNPLETAWELVPYSFVADWFVNVGDILEQQGQLYRDVDILDGFSRRDVGNYNLVIPDIEVMGDLGEPQVVQTSLLSFNVPRRWYKRDFTTQLPTVNFSIDTEFHTFKHVLDSIFLLSQRYKR